MTPLRERAVRLLVGCTLVAGALLARAGVAAAAAWSQSPAPTPAPATALTAAQQAFARRDWKDAARRSAAVAAAATSPAERSTALRLQAKAEVNLQDFPAADRTLRALLASEPNDAAALYLWGFTLERRNDPRQSLQVFTRAATLETPTADDVKLAGLDYVLLNDYKDALYWFRRAVSMDPRNAEAWYDLGRTQMHEGEFPPAEASFRRTLALVPAHVKALDNLGLALEAQNRPEEALKAYAAAIQAQDGHAPDSRAQGRAEPLAPSPPSLADSPRLNEQPLLNYGALLNTRNSFAVAADVLSRATGIAPASPRCWEELARAEVGLGRNAEARTAMEHAVTLDGNNPRLHYQLGRIYRSLELKAQADAEFARSAALYGNRSSAPQP